LLKNKLINLQYYGDEKASRVICHLYKGAPMKKKLKIPPTTAEWLLSPFQNFLHQQTSGGIVLLAFTALALAWSNSIWADSYNQIWHTKLTMGYGAFELSKPLLLWINDGLMAIFFFVVGLEIKREVLAGELSTIRQASLPIMAAIGGMLVPALIYVLFNAGGEGKAGWGIPMATDIAFALGILALLGTRAPISLKIFLTALAIVDDLGAVLVIALFYTAEISWISLLVAFVVLVALVIINTLGVRNPLVYGLLGIVLWVAFLKSGVHATVAGVLLAMTIPSRSRINTDQFIGHSRIILDNFENAGKEKDQQRMNNDQQAALHVLEETVEHVEAPLYRLEHALHPWVAFFIMPIFALANAGVKLGNDFSSTLASPVSLGIILGLVFGKQIGITVFSWLAIKLKIADLPKGIEMRHIYGASCLAGIGFTMSLFISGLAFGETPPLSIAKTSILIASVIAGILGWSILRSLQVSTDNKK